MQIHLVSVGRMKEGPLRAAAEEYLKRLRPYARVRWDQVDNEPFPVRMVAAEVEAVLLREAERVRRLLAPGDYVVALDRAGEMVTSEELAADIARLAAGGTGRIAWVIGGPLGLHDSLLRRADRRLSLSPLTFPHQLVPVILLEQLYRAFKIQRGEPYHW